MDRDDEIPAFYSSAGPCLPGDDPNDIFDDYSGPYGAQMPSPGDDQIPAPYSEPRPSEMSDSELEEFEGEEESDGDSYGDHGAEDAARDGEALMCESAARASKVGLGADMEGPSGTRNGEAYFGAHAELEDLTEGEILPEDWWPWSTHEVR